MNDKNVDDILKKLASDEIPTDIHEIAESVSRDLSSNVTRMRQSKHRVWWETIMRSKTAKLAAAAVIVAVVLFGVLQHGSSIESVAWGEIVQKIRQSHNDHVEQLLLAVEAKNAEKVEFYADMLDEFWQGLNWLARANSDPQFQAQLIAEARARIEDRREGPDEEGIGMFLTHADEFLDWLGKIEDEAWIDETMHVCKQLEEYLEEIRDGARSEELGWPYIEHCVPGFLAYCQWFEQLPWDDPTQVMTDGVHLAGIQRELEMADREIRDPMIRGGHRWVRRGLEQAQKDAQALASGAPLTPTDADASARRCRKLAQNLHSTIDLITYMEIALWDLQQSEGIEHDEACRRLLQRDLAGQGPLQDYLLNRVGKSLELCREIGEDPGTR